MRKTFQLSHPKIKYPRRIEAAKHDIRKYIARERRRTLPEGVDFWDFDCRFGATEGSAETVHLSEIPKCIDKMQAQQLTAFYVEVIAKPGHRTKRPTSPDAPPGKTKERPTKSEVE